MRTPGAELLDLITTPSPTRAVGEITASCTDPTAGIPTGFESHRGHTTRGPGVAALFVVERGTGNGDGTDCVLTDTVIGSYLHRPVLARNPRLADLVLRRVTGLSDLLPTSTRTTSAPTTSPLLGHGRDRGARAR